MPGIKVLLVEDDWIIAKEIAYNLQDLGFEVAASVDNAEEAYRQIKTLQPDIVILDIDLSGDMTGIDLAKQLLGHGGRAKKALVVSTEILTPNFYHGDDRAFLIQGSA